MQAPHWLCAPACAARDLELVKRGLHGNVGLNVASMVLPFATTVLTVPRCIAEISATRYGIPAMVWVLLSTIGFLGFGPSRASGNALSWFSRDSALGGTALLAIKAGIVAAALGVGLGPVLRKAASRLFAVADTGSAGGEGGLSEGFVNSTLHVKLRLFCLGTGHDKSYHQWTAAGLGGTSNQTSLACEQVNT